MRDFKTMGSLANRLLGYISTTQVHDANYEIALAMIRNYQQLKGHSINEIAEICFSSTASISRFVKFMGFENFKEFKFYLDQDFSMKDDYSRQLYSILCEDEKSAISMYRDELIQNIYSTISPENLEVIPDIIDAIHNSPKVAYFSHHFLWDIGRFFQGKMMLMGKYIEQFLAYDAQLESAQSLDESSLAIVCTIGGSYISRYDKIWKTIVESNCKILVITQNLSSANLNYAEYILQCGISNRDDIGKYSAMMMTDFLVMLYYKKYGR